MHLFEKFEDKDFVGKDNRQSLRLFSHRGYTQRDREPSLFLEEDGSEVFQSLGKESNLPHMGI